MNTSQVKNIKDAFDKVAILGATGRSSTNAVYPPVLNNVLGTKFKIVTGYEGTAAVMLAMERGEVEGLSSTYDGLKTQRQEWLRGQEGEHRRAYLLRRHPELPDVPTSEEVASHPRAGADPADRVERVRDRQVRLHDARRSRRRVAALRTAFDAMVKDPEFLAEATKLRIEIDPLTGTELQKIVEETQSISADIIEKVKAIYPLN